jgi:hypothetical protein
MTNYFRMSTPFEILIRFKNSGNVGVVRRLLAGQPEDYWNNLPDSQRSKVAALRRQLEEWIDIELQHGRGAALNLDDRIEMSKLMRVLGKDPRFLEYLANAERYRNVSGAAWLWTER